MKHNLRVKAFSALLFNMLTRRRKRPQRLMALKEEKKRWLRRWVNEWKKERQLQERYRVYKHRKETVVKRMVLIAVYVEAQREKKRRYIAERVKERVERRGVR
jgi:hypothetical protein